MSPRPPDSVIGHDARVFMAGMAAATPPSGCFVEVGVYKGGSAWHLAQIAEAQNRHIHLFDTFNGIPYKGPLDAHEVGDFSDVDVESVRDAIPYARVHIGVFPQSAKRVCLAPIAFAHIDVDQYAATADCLRYLIPLMMPGGIMLFDDVWCLPSATLAVEERGLLLERTPHGKAFARF